MILQMVIGIKYICICLSARVCLSIHRTVFLVDLDIRADESPVRYSATFFSSFRQRLFFSSSSWIPGYLPQPATQESPRLLTDL